jgi:heptosyltransferase-2
MKILIAQTAFIGDVILATPLVEKLHRFYPDARIDFLLRKGNESLLAEHPFISEVIIWDKKEGKYKSMWQIIRKLRASQYDYVINLQRFAASGIMTGFSGAKKIIGFDKNPFSFLYTKRLPHKIGDNIHEVSRNLSLITHFTDESNEKPKLYPSASDIKKVQIYTHAPYICIAPTSVWFTKQLKLEKWIEFINKNNFEGNIYLLGATADSVFCEKIIAATTNKKVINLCGKLTLLESAALMQSAVMNYVNDSAPMHLASATNAPVRAVFCSTIPAFGFTPLSDNAKIIEVKGLACRPCGLHGYKACPLSHFNCATQIDVQEMML